MLLAILPCLQLLLESLHQAGIEVVSADVAPPATHYHAIRLLNAPDGDILEWLETFAEHAHLRIDCPYLRLPPSEIKAHAAYFWAVLAALRPSQALQALVQKGVSKLRGMHDSRSNKSFTFLHLKVENSWLAHCERWSHIMVRSNACRVPNLQ